jgi:hypothetical protein
MGSNKRVMEGDHLSKEQWEASQDVDPRDVVQEEPKGPFAKASDAEMKGRRIIRVTRKRYGIYSRGDFDLIPSPVSSLCVCSHEYILRLYILCL